MASHPTTTTNRAASAPASLPTGGRIIWLRPPLPGTYTTPSPPRTISPITPTWSPITPPAAAAATTTNNNNSNNSNTTTAATATTTTTYTGVNIHNAAPNTAASALSALNSPVVLAEQRPPGQGGRRELGAEMRDEDWEEGSEEDEEDDEDEMEGVE